jgi:hypothetical protein
MAGSNNSMESISMLFRKASENQRSFIENICKIIIVHDDENILNTFKIMASPNSSSNRIMRIFDNVYACSDFLTRISDNYQLKLIVFVGGQLVHDLVSSIHHREQVQVIFILNKPPFTEEERNTMKLYSKVNTIIFYKNERS